MANEIIKADDTLTPTGWIVPADLSFEDWQQVGASIGNAGKTLGLIVGDWLNAHRGEWGSMYDEAMALTGFSYDRLKNLKYITEAVKMSSRKHNLTIKHYSYVAKYRNNPELQTYWLTLAEQSGWSARALAEAIKEDEAKEAATAHKKQEEAPVFAEPKQNPTPFEMANELAEKGEGYTEEEWNEKPYSYTGDCFKQCYGPGLMVKGDVWEYGVRGVYVCSSCSYAYPPMMEPDEVDLEECNRINEDLEEDEESEQEHSVHFSSATPEWYTPKHIITRVIQTFGVIDLDPCSNGGDTPNIPAITHFTKEDDGLSKQWAGRTYMNPPYGNDIVLWVKKILKEYLSGRIPEAIILAPARTDTQWFQLLREFPKCFITGRLKFVGGSNSAPFPSMLVYLGQNIETFFNAFSDMGDVYELKEVHIEKQS